MRWLILLTYLAQFIAVSRFPVPSEVSTLQLMKQNRAGLPAFSRIPLMALGALGIVTFHLPLIFSAFPALTPGRGVIFIPPGSVFFTAVVGLLLLGGTGLTVLGVKTLREWPPATPETPRPLRTGGVYGFCRHPVNLGLMVVMAGFFLAYPLWLMVPGTLAFFYNLHRRAQLEEAFLTAEYGDTYRRYRSRVPMYGLPPRTKQSQFSA